MPILPHDIGLRSETVANIGHIAKVDCGTADLSDGQVIQLRNSARTRVHANVVLELINFCRATGQYKVLVGHRIEHILRGESFCLKQVRIQVNHYLALFSSIREWDNRTRNRDQLWPDEVLPQ